MSRTAPSSEEVHDAFYVDYEAWEKAPPIILGVLRVLDGVESFRKRCSTKSSARPRSRRV